MHTTGTEELPETPEGLCVLENESLWFSEAAKFPHFQPGCWGMQLTAPSFPITYRIPKEPGPPPSIDLGSPAGEGGGLVFVLTVLAFVDITELNAT